jgi:hypothetical protein
MGRAYNTVMRGLTGVLCLAITTGASAQTPQPFPTPRPSAPAPASPGAQQPRPAPPPAGSAAAPAAPAPNAAPAAAPQAPDLDVPLYPNAVYLGSYDAGRGQRFHLYGVLLPYLDAVTFYRATLKTRGDELFESPPTHTFDLGRFREADVAFPPSVTVKDYTWGGAAGYPNPRAGEKPERFPTVIQIVSAPTGAK